MSNAVASRRWRDLSRRRLPPIGKRTAHRGRKMRLHSRVLSQELDDQRGRTTANQTGTGRVGLSRQPRDRPGTPVIGEGSVFVPIQNRTWGMTGEAVRRLLMLWIGALDCRLSAPPAGCSVLEGCGPCLKTTPSSRTSRIANPATIRKGTSASERLRSSKVPIVGHRCSSGIWWNGSLRGDFTGPLYGVQTGPAIRSRGHV